MAKIRSWEVSDEFWQRVKPLLAKRERDQTQTFQRRPGEEGGSYLRISP